VLLGILADIHEALPRLREALALLRRHGAEQLVMLGDVIERCQHLAETVELLAGAGVVGVWGNHELGLCCEPDASIRRQYAGPILDFFSSLQGRLVIEDCYFSHVQAWMDPADLEQPWYLHPAPATLEQIAQNLEAVPQRLVFMGHYHRWLAATAEGVLPWSGTEPICLAPPRRHVVVIHAVSNGWCALYNTATGLLTPLALTAPAKIDE
jgi:predicted phosphodiesterase